MVEFLIQQGANLNVRDSKVNSTPAGWADHGGHAKLKQYLEQIWSAQKSKSSGV
jgi:hypothetical protein